MFRWLFGLLCLCHTGYHAYAQFEYPLATYVQLRERLINKYLIVGEGHGCSLPASWYDSTRSQLVYEDETTRQLGWYLALLATEHHLNELHGKDNQATRRELYFAIRAIQRLDRYAEYLQCSPASTLSWDEQSKRYNTNTSCWSDTIENNLNGYIMREDIPPGWHKRFPGDQPVRHGNGYSNWIVQDKFNKSPNPASQDQIYHLLFGFAFIQKYLPDTLVVNSLNIRQEAQNIAYRFAEAFNQEFRLKNPITGGVVDADLGGNAKFYAFLFAVAADRLVNGKIYPSSKERQKAYDEQNRWFSQLVKNNKNLWTHFTTLMWAGASLASPNQIMTMLLLCVGNALNGSPENNSFVLLNKVSSFINPEYRFFQNAYMLLQNKKYSFGYTQHEMQTMLLAMDEPGPRRYTISGSCNFLQNKVWNRDCIFVQPRILPCTDQIFEGHFNGIDYMLFHNIYFLQFESSAKENPFPPVDLSGPEFKVIPNPTSSQISLAYSCKHEELVNIFVSDASGRIVYKQQAINLPSGEGQYQLPVPGLVQGIYFLSVYGRNFQKQIRVLLL
ncbi:MAG: T9SS type A sorting domain-containing protein [Bacteroidia bacterium]|jgi:hypothetical protein|nr:T9SS type A sorting domain-containing protein [Bacteroidia bacterium]